MVPPIKRPILPIVIISISPNSKEPLTTPECIAVEPIDRTAARNMASYRAASQAPRANSEPEPENHKNLDHRDAGSSFLASGAKLVWGGNASPTSKSRSAIAVSQKLFSIYVSFIRENGPEGPMRTPATRNPRIIDCLEM